MRAPEAARAVDVPEAGHFAMKLTKGGPRVPARISHDDGVWSAIIDTVPQTPPHADPAHAAGVFRIWHSAERITLEDYSYMVAFRAWAEANQPDHPCLHPTDPIDFNKLPADF